jgi:hypothetical protein
VRRLPAFRRVGKPSVQCRVAFSAEGRFDRPARTRGADASASDFGFTGDFAFAAEGFDTAAALALGFAVLAARPGLLPSDATISLLAYSQWRS